MQVNDWSVIDDLTVFCEAGREQRGAGVAGTASAQRLGKRREVCRHAPHGGRRAARRPRQAFERAEAITKEPPSA